MNNFRTTLKPFNSKNRISYKDRIFLMGSCFAQEIGSKLNKHCFQTYDSPFGIVFNPLTIFNQINRMISGIPYVEEELIYNNNLYHSWDHHGSYSGIDKISVLQNINVQLSRSRENLKKSEYIILSFGSAHYYSLVKNGQVVSNCHKLAANHFVKDICDFGLLLDQAIRTFEKIFEFNPSVKVILTVSPVRYIKDGLMENNQSKARLFMLVEELGARFEQIEYFPSYELLIDDLRDYRFYKEDMVHPSEQAVQYIWDFFIKTYCEAKTIETINKVNQLNQLLAHIPIHNTESGLNQINSKIENLKNEILRLESRINFEV